MSTPTRGSWRKMKKVVRYLVWRKRVVWRFCWQEEPRGSYVVTDSDWGGTKRDRRSTSGGVWFLRGHCIKTWSSTQRAYALSSAEAEFYGMIEGVTKAKGLVVLASELGCQGLSCVVKLGTDRAVAKSFVSGRGLRENAAH